MTDPSFTDVLIVGAGPVGLTLANILVRHGITCRIIDQLPAYQKEIRAKGLTPRTEEIFEDLGILDQIHARGSRNRLFRFYERDQLVRELDPATDPTNQPTPDAPYRGPFFISQAQTEAVLRERLTQLEARGATGIIFGTSGYDVERELRAYAEVARLR